MTSGRLSRALIVAALAPFSPFVAPAAAATAPEAPLTETCGGPVVAGSQRICGTLNPSTYAKVGYYFAYNVGADCKGGEKTPAGEEVEGERIAVSSELSGLAPSTEYAYCLVATNQFGETYGQPVTFTTPAQDAPPEAPLSETCLGGPLLSATTQRICGTLNPSTYAKVGYYFAYNVGADCKGGGKTPAGEEVEGERIAVSSELSGLAPSTEYAYCLVATNQFGETYGQPVTFTTAGESPSIFNESAGAIAETGATLEATIDTANQRTSYSFVYGTDSSLAGAVAANGEIVAPAGGQTVSVRLESLTPNQAYYYRIVAGNASGVSEGAVRSFTTLPAAALTPSISPMPPPLVVPTPPAAVQPHVVLTNAQKLKKALRACRKKPRRRRAKCRRMARKRYASRRVEMET